LPQEDFEERLCRNNAVQRNEAMKISSILRDLFTHRVGGADTCQAAWADDPYAHPAIRAMTERERADLPPFHMAVRAVRHRPAPC
jgi:hypothetical protein